MKNLTTMFFHSGNLAEYKAGIGNVSIVLKILIGIYTSLERVAELMPTI